MLGQVCPTVPPLGKVESIDSLLEPMLKAARAGEPLKPPLLEIARSFGFESFAYAITTASRPDRDSRSYVWTSLPDAWVHAYEENAYVEVDPRVGAAFDRASPFLWDAATIPGPARVRRFLAHAAEYGIRSGVVVAFNGLEHCRAGFALNSSVSPVSPERGAEITRHLGTLMVIGTRVQDLFMSQVINRGLPPIQQGKTLSRRERQCLEMAARGLSSADIGIKLGISERGVNFHLGHALRKLSALNRSEAIARAITLGLIRL